MNVLNVFVRYLTEYDEPILNYYERNAVTQESDHISAATLNLNIQT